MHMDACAHHVFYLVCASDRVLEMTMNDGRYTMLAWVTGAHLFLQCSQINEEEHIAVGALNLLAHGHIVEESYTKEIKGSWV